MIEKLSFKRKILLLLATAIVGVSLVSGLAFLQLREELIGARKATLKAAVQSAATLAAGYQAAAASGTMSEADAMKTATDALRTARYGDLAGKADYFYIITTDGRAVMHPYQTLWVPGKSVLGTLNSALRRDYDRNGGRFCTAAFWPYSISIPSRSEFPCRPASGRW